VFAVLRAHSWYSLREGVDSPDDLVRRAAQAGVEALALTDVNSLAGAVEFLDAARRYGVRPILGAHLRQGQTAVSALVADPAGYANLCRALPARATWRTSTRPGGYQSSCTS